MITPPPIDEPIDRLEDEEELWARLRRGFQWRANLEQRAIGFAGSEGMPDHRGGRFAYRLRDDQRLRNVAGVPQAIFKVIPGGGVGSRGELVAQLNYLSRDGAQVLEMGGDPTGYEIDGQDAIRDLATDWAMAWEHAASRDGRTARAKSKSFHLLVSYPEGTDPDMAQMAAEAFTEELCQSGAFGDRWRYVSAWHTDRAHPHMHVVIERLGASGRMMQIHPAKTINPKSLRALQVETAAEFGIALNDTPRVSRGYRDRGLSSPEWRAEQRGQRRERSPTRQVYTKMAASFADDAIAREAYELRKLSERLQQEDAPERREEAKAIERAALVLSSGGTLDTRSFRDHSREVKPRDEERRKDRSEIERTAGQTPEFEPPRSVNHADAPKPDRRATSKQTHEQDVFDALDEIGREISKSVHRIERSETGPSRGGIGARSERSEEGREQELRLNRKLTEQELRDLLDLREREMIEQEKQRRSRDDPSRGYDRGSSYGFD